MGCSSSRIPRNRSQPENGTGRLPATPGGAGGGVPPKVGANNSVGMDDLDGDNPDFKKTLILKKNQQSMEGRQNQVWMECRKGWGCLREKMIRRVYLVPTLEKARRKERSGKATCSIYLSPGCSTESAATVLRTICSDTTSFMHVGGGHHASCAQ